MKLTKTLMATSALTVAAGVALAGGHMASEMVLVSWGGAYQSSQDRAYVQPYLEMNDGVSATWDESSAEAVAKLRAMNEAGNVTWDLVDVVAADAIRLCDAIMLLLFKQGFTIKPFDNTEHEIAYFSIDENVVWKSGITVQNAFNHNDGSYNKNRISLLRLMLILLC